MTRDRVPVETFVCALTASSRSETTAGSMRPVGEDCRCIRPSTKPAIPSWRYALMYRSRLLCPTGVFAAVNSETFAAMRSFRGSFVSYSRRIGTGESASSTSSSSGGAPVSTSTTCRRRNRTRSRATVSSVSSTAAESSRGKRSGTSGRKLSSPRSSATPIFRIRPETSSLSANCGPSCATTCQVCPS